MFGKIDCLNCKTTECFVQKHCSNDWVSMISQSKNQVGYKKAQYMFREGDRVFGMHFVLEGKVKIISTGLNGKEQIVRLASDAHVVGHRGYAGEIYPVGALAIDDTTACFLDNDILYDAFMNNPKFTYALMMFYSSELRKTEIRQRHLSQMTIREKMADTLLYLKDIFGVNGKEKSLNVILSRQEIADIAGTTSEQVTRELTGFETELLIAKRGKKIVLLNLHGLAKIISGHNVNRYIEQNAINEQNKKEDRLEQNSYRS